MNGGIVPTMNPRLRSPRAGEKVDIEIRYYGTKIGKYALYDDDGETFDYDKGDFSWRQISIERESSGNIIYQISSSKPGKPDNIGNITWKQMTVN
jgi:alpha-D-xyloside xylohydrolase